MKLLRAAAHDAVAATNRLHAALMQTLPPGTRVKVSGWKGTLQSYYLPLEGDLLVLPDDIKQASGYRLVSVKTGCVMVHVDRVELMDSELSD